MLYNIVDNRIWKYTARCSAVLEPSRHDNTVEGADQVEGEATELAWLVETYDDITVRDAVLAAEGKADATTVYLYDIGKHMSD